MGSRRCRDAVRPLSSKGAGCLRPPRRSSLILVAVGWNLRNLSFHPSARPDPVGRQTSSAARDDVPQEISPPVVVDAGPAPAVPATVEAVEETATPLPVIVASSDTGGPGPEPQGDAAAENVQARTLRFTTRRGTQIIWILDPELEL